MEGSCVLVLLEVFGVGCFVLEGLAEKLALGGVEVVALREDNLEFEIEVAETHRIFIKRHAKLLDCLSLSIFQDFSWSSRNNILSPIEMLDSSSNTSQGFKQGNLLMINKISPDSLIQLISFDIDPDIDISSHNSRVLITLPIEDVVVRIRNTLLYSYFDDLLRLFYALTLASLATIRLLNYYTEPAAVVAGRLNLGIHSWTKLGELHCHA